MNSDYRNLILRTGFYLWLPSAVLALILGLTQAYKNPSSQWLTLLILPIQLGVLYLALRKLSVHTSSRRSLFKSGMLISLVSSVLTALGSLILTYYIFPEYLQELRTTMISQLQQQQVSASELDQAVASFDNAASPTSASIIGFINSLISGAILTGITVYYIFKQKAKGLLNS